MSYLYLILILILFLVLAAMSGASFGLLTVWAGLGRTHWFVRFVLVAAVIGGLLPTAAFLALVFVSQALVVAVPLMLVRRYTVAAEAGNSVGSASTWHGWSRFSLGDLFRATLLIAAVCCVVAYLPGEVRAKWWKHVLLGATLGVATLAGAWAALGRRLGCLRWGVLYIAALLVFVLTPVDEGFNFSPYVIVFKMLWCAVMASVGLLVALWLSLAKAAGVAGVAAWRRAEYGLTGQPATAHSVGVFRRRRASIGLGLVSLAILLLPAVAYYDMLHPAPIPTGPPPEPNAYDDLLRLAAALQSESTPGGSLATEAEQQASAERRRVLFDEVHSALRRPSAVPPVRDVSIALVHFGDQKTFRQLSLDLHAEGDRHRVAGNTIGAQRSYLDVVELGLASSRGGTSRERTFGTQFGYEGIEGLRQLRGALSRDQRRALIAALQAHDAGWEPTDELHAREHAYWAREWGWPARISFINALIYLMHHPFESDAFFSLHEGLRSARLRLLVCELALAQYVADHGGPPAQLAELVPQYLPEVPRDPFSGAGGVVWNNIGAQYLPEVPRDPFSGRPLIYRAEPPGYMLYSVGPNRRDDGGQRGGSLSDGDLFLDPAAAGAAVPGGGEHVED